MASILNDSLYKNKGIEIRRSSKNGWGVFARRNIKKDSILEESPIIIVPTENANNSPEFMTYCYGFDDENVLLGFGFSGLYNHSFEPNANWIRDHVNMTMTHYAIRDIKAGEEILINYGEENIDFDVK